MRKTVVILILIPLLFVACAKHADPPPLRFTKSDFGVRLQDKTLEIPKTVAPLKPLDLGGLKNFQISSRDWFGLADELGEAGKFDADDLALSRRLFSVFYQDKNAYDVVTAEMDPPGSPYGEVTFWYAKPVLKEKLVERINHVEEKVSKLTSDVNVDLHDLTEKYPLPELVLGRIVESLKTFDQQLNASKDGLGDTIVDSISSQVQDKYIKDLLALQDSITLKPEVPLLTSQIRIEENLKKLTEVSDFERRHLLMMVGLGISLTEDAEQVKDAGDALGFVTDLWLAKRSRLNFPDGIRKVFDGLTEPQILALATRNAAELVPPETWNGIKDETDVIPLPDKQVLAIYLQNKGNTLSDDDWKKLEPRVKVFDALFAKPEFVDFSRVVANHPSEKVEDQRYSLILSWLGVMVRLGIPKELKEILATLSERQIDSLGHTNSALLFGKTDVSLAKYRWAITDALGKKGGIEKILQLFNESIMHSLRERFDLFLVPVARELGSQIKEALVPELNKRKENNDANVTDLVKDYACYYLGTYVFGIKGLKKPEGPADVEKNRPLLQSKTLPLFERSSLSFAKSGSSWQSTNPGHFETTAETVGLALAGFSSRLGTSREDNVALEFEAISKLLALAGYRDNSGHWIESLNVNMDADPAAWTKTLAIIDYEPDKALFATPDIFKIKNSMRIDPDSKKNPTVSVSGQMALLHGYAKLMEYSRPWEPSAYDSELGAVRVDEEPKLEPFDRQDFFLLSVGLAAQILKNIPHKMLAIIDKDHKYVDGTKISDLEKVEKTAAALTDYTRDGHSFVVRTRDLARAIRALAEFYEQSKNIQKATHPTIVKNLAGGKYEEARDNIQKLVSGMIIFATTYLMEDDGGFSAQFDLNKMEAARGPRVLEDQLEMEEALIIAGETLNSGFMVARAVDNYFFLNNTMWSKELGFYRGQENGVPNKLKLENVARATNVLQALLRSTVTRGINNDSLKQMKALVDAWKERFLSEKILRLSAVEQISEFSL